ncbi:hypothetical protein [Enterobacter sp. UNJFSC 003]|uniref:hypothetical protein n=1 Tax=Enterobacter sp. UNJFSC 003 TaxID=3122077 RepID=UPI002EA86C30|nr:hypothetical protein [Serratia liquefaciens]
MNAKTTSILTIINIALSLLLLPLLVVAIHKLVGIYSYLPMNCMSTVHINRADEKNALDGINGNIKIVFHITNEGLVTVSEYGTLNYHGKEYLVDRTGNMMMDKDVQNGFHKVTRGKFVSNLQHNAPSELTEKLTSSQPVLHYKIDKLDTETWRISDLQRSIFICRK